MFRYYWYLASWVWQSNHCTIWTNCTCNAFVFNFSCV